MVSLTALKITHAVSAAIVLVAAFAFLERQTSELSGDIGIVIISLACWLTMFPGVVAFCFRAGIDTTVNGACTLLFVAATCIVVAALLLIEGYLEQWMALFAVVALSFTGMIFSMASTRLTCDCVSASRCCHEGKRHG